MNARILCPGPSLARYRSGDFAGITLAVNRAALCGAGCDIWVACDYLLVNRVAHSIPGRPTLLTSRDSVRHIKPAWLGKLETFESLCDTVAIGTPGNWARYSFMAAIICAAARGATSIDCFGVDWAGDLDFDGTAAGTYRNDERWADEARIFSVLRAAMEGAGVTVRLCAT